ncbi:MAG: amidohydrolase [Candidatus Cloacimonetes bacterium]|nr:amidohydrolase [Candidatus Cloacimonadota bacterium]
MLDKINNLDILIKNARIVTMNENNDIIDKGFIGINNNEIKFVDTMENIDEEFKVNKVIDADGKIVFPGLINTHGHAYQILLKGLGADLKLMDWVKVVVAPYSQKITREINYYAALLVALESLQSGCTTVADFFYAHHKPKLSDGVIEGFMDMGLRGIMIRNFHDCGVENGIPESYLESPEEAFLDVDRLINKYEEGSNGMIRIWTGPGVTWGITKEGLEATVEYSKHKNIPYSIHLLETEDDNKHMMKEYGKKAVEIMEEVGFLSSDLLAAHCVKLADRECKILGEKGVNVAYNAASNMYLGSGVPPIIKLKEAGARISLGTDGAASNNAMDMIETLKLSALLQKVFYEKPNIISAEEVLNMATFQAAQSLQMEKEIGSLGNGKKADLFIFNPDKPKSFPLHDPIASLVYSASLDNVETTIVNGKVLYENNKFKTAINKEYIFKKIKEIISELIKSN